MEPGTGAGYSLPLRLDVVRVTWTILSVVVSVLATLIVAHIYYRRATKDLRHIVDRLPESVATKLAEEQRRKLTLNELEELIQEAGAYPTEYGLFPTKCPHCGGEVEIRGEGPTEHSDAEAWPYCPNCDRNL